MEVLIWHSEPAHPTAFFKSHCSFKVPLHDIFILHDYHHQEDILSWWLCWLSLENCNYLAFLLVLKLAQALLRVGHLKEQTSKEDQILTRIDHFTWYNLYSIFWNEHFLTNFSISPYIDAIQDNSNAKVQTIIRIQLWTSVLLK